MGAERSRSKRRATHSFVVVRRQFVRLPHDLTRLGGG